MILFARLLCFLALMAFAVGAVAHSAGSAAMASAMITADAGMSGMDDCNACGDPQAGLKGAVCDFVCNVTGMVAVPIITTGTDPVATSMTHDRMPERVARGITGPPAYEPPRFHL